MQCFNPRTRMGCDLQFLRLGVRSVGFQSTHPHGVRRIVSSPSLSYSGFNPRTRMGCDNIVGYASICHLVSIHAPAWGATSPDTPIESKLYVSIHAPAWGATIKIADKLDIKVSFNPRTRMGCDTDDMRFI